MANDKVLDALSKVDQILATQKEEASKNNNKTKNKGNFKNLDTIYLNSVVGSYEMRLLTDDNGELFEKVFLHGSLNLSSKKKTTVVCKGEECEICQNQQKLHETGFPTAWKYRKYHIIKVLIQTGKINSSNSDDLKPNTTYIAYINDDFFNSLLGAIQSTKQYNPNELGASMDYNTNLSGGFIVSASKVNKKMSYNFMFQPALGLPSTNVRELIGKDKALLVNEGMFRNSYVNPTKFGVANSNIAEIIMKIASGELKVPAKKEKAKKDAPADAPKADQPAPTPEEVAKPVETPATTEESKPENPNPELPECYGNFKVSEAKCVSECAHKNNCLQKAMAEGKL